MIFGSPLPLNTTLQDAVVRTVLPVSLRSNLAHELPAPILRRSTFLAADAQAETLQRVNDAITDIIGGGGTEEQQRSLLQRLPDILSHTELAKDYRMRLILDTNVDLARGYGGYMQSQDAEILDEWPAWEFYRAEFRKEPRDWPSRWEDAGGDFYPGRSDYPQGRMIALKDDPIWTEISRFGQPYAPFDFNSGMDLRDVDHDECVKLGLIAPDERVSPERIAFNAAFEALPELTGAILGALGIFTAGAGLGYLAADGIFHLGGSR